MKKDTLRNVILLLVSCFSCLLILEFGIRFFVYPSVKSYGTFLGRELPPVKVIPYKFLPKTDRSQWLGNLIVEGQRITKGDVWGIIREDPVLGYAPQENAISANGWWQSNNLGARARVHITKDKPRDKKRILVFGESFANGSGIPQEEAWPSILHTKSDRVEVINFGVDGYSMAQSFLRYRGMRNRIDYDLVLLMFVPTLDLWRDINTIRFLGEDWNIFIVLPRFVLEQGELKLIKSPYEVGSSIFEKNANTISEELKTHLRKYDRFYSRSYYEEPWLIGKSVVYKLFALAFHRLQKRFLQDNLKRVDSEAMQVSKKIFEAMNYEVKRDGKEFVLLFVPIHRDLKKLKADSHFRSYWHEMVSSICGSDLHCMDLSEDLLQVPIGQLGRAYDRMHYGPKGNGLIADAIKKQLKQYFD